MFANERSCEQAYKRAAYNEVPLLNSFRMKIADCMRASEQTNGRRKCLLCCIVLFVIYSILYFLFSHLFLYPPFFRFFRFFLLSKIREN